MMEEEKSTHDALPLRTVSRLTGLTPDIIRAWEKRYGVVAPRRGPRGARLYSAVDVARLRLLQRVTAAGRAIGDVAQLSTHELERLGSAPLAARGDGGDGRGVVEPQFLETMVDALARFDAVSLDRALGDALVAFGTRDFVIQVAGPLLEEVGIRWGDGRLSIADEHLLSAMMRNLLTGVMRTRGHTGGPTVLFATPAGERHEFGLLLAGLMVAEAGLRLCYLGTDLPAAEVAAAARRADAAVVGLGVVYSDNEAQAAAEVRRVERELPPGTELWLGGRAAAAMAGRMGSSRAIVLDQMTALEHELTRIRAHPAPRV
jgi:MerR family transcriptional regulator, light-induced transcriptional regulator